MLRTEIWGATNKCTRCGRNNHFVADCFANTTIDGDEIEECVWVCDVCNQEFFTEELVNNHVCRGKSYKGRPIVCYKCGTPGHYANTCWVRK